jgi:SseB protein N-terminal domain
VTLRPPARPAPARDAAEPAEHPERAEDTEMTTVTDDNTATPAADPAADGAVERALAAAVSNVDRVEDLLDELSRGRLWIPLPDDGQPVTDGSAVNLPTVTYLGAEFVPAFTSAERLRRSSWPPGDQPPSVAPHVMVPAAGLARLLPEGIGIALNPGAEQSVPVYPEGVAYLASAAEERSAGPAQPDAADRRAPALQPTSRISVGLPPAEPAALLAAIRRGLADVPAAIQAATAWLSVEQAGEGLVISVSLEDPGDAAAQRAALDVIERAAAAAVGEAPFPIDVTFPGEGEPDVVDEWVTANALPFYLRG